MSNSSVRKDRIFDDVNIANLNVRALNARQNVSVGGDLTLNTVELTSDVSGNGLFPLYYDPADGSLRYYDPS